jgi:ABC-type multidrug transport system ATPase subunit
MLLGLVRPTSGRATVHGAAPGSPRAVARTGALVEGPGFYPYLSGRDNLRVLARYQGLTDHAADAALERVDLAGRDRFRSYSLGMKQRLGVAAALLGGPDLLILDEPTNGLDPAGMADMRSLLVDIAAGGQTVLLSSHLLAEVQEICDRVGVISEGRMLTESTVAELRGATVVQVANRVEHSWARRADLGYRYDHAHGSRVLVDRLTACEYVHETREAGSDGSRLTDHSGLAVRLALTTTATLLTSDPAMAATHAEPEPRLF